MIQIAFSEVFDRIKQSTGVKNQSELAVLLGCTEMNISRAKKRGKIPAEWLIKLLRSHELIPDWIITGEGPQYLKPDFARGETNVNGNVLFFIANLPTSKGKQITRVIFSDVFKRIQQVTGVKNQSKLAELLGYHDMTISAAKRRRTIPAAWLVKLLRTHSVNPDWIITGRGPRYLMPDLTRSKNQ